ncbi:hypothetical protein J8273_5419 [Carpediemonas membranifera]|uniref:Uncharacterized protein n=1 Tax=Carpediemonas membranifera TaxID=201153 RepID=A0A8J6B3W0_9EUKA|nr:hypothetical protein J8273_5419 [Carpediemonas membranifera]|eukprot:KAG9392429.1 hypothetical protein J8273_5419 [Carpediemonas membranifera]
MADNEVIPEVSVPEGAPEHIETEEPVVTVDVVRDELQSAEVGETPETPAEEQVSGEGLLDNVDKPASEPASETSTKSQPGKVSETISELRSQVDIVAKASMQRTTKAFTSINRLTSQLIFDTRHMGTKSNSLSYRHEMALDFRLPRIDAILGEWTCSLVHENTIGGVFILTSSHVLFKGVGTQSHVRVTVALADVQQLMMQGENVVAASEGGKGYMWCGFGSLSTTYHKVYSQWMQVLNEKRVLEKREEQRAAEAMGAEQE